MKGPEALARRDRTRLRFCRSKPLHEGLYASAWDLPRRLAATAGNYSEVLNRRTAAVDLLDSNPTDPGCFVFTRARTPDRVALRSTRSVRCGGGYAQTAPTGRKRGPLAGARGN